MLDVYFIAERKDLVPLKEFLQDNLKGANIVDLCINPNQVNKDSLISSLEGDNKSKVAVVTSASIFSKLTKERVASRSLGSGKRLKGTKDDTPILVYYLPSFMEIQCNPQQEELAKWILGNVYNAITSDLSSYKEDFTSNIVINYGYDIDTVTERLQFIKTNYAKVTVDIETFGLQHNSKIASIAIGLNENEADSIILEASEDITYATNARNLIKKFFDSYKGTLIFHNCLFDVCVLTRNLYMKDDKDYEGMYKGLDILLRDYEDTKLIAYLCLNSCARPDLSLKTLSVEKMGSYAVDVSDIEKALTENKLSISELLKYNGLDTIATWYVYNKYYPVLVKDTSQFKLYSTLYKKSAYVLLTMQLVGMSINPARVQSLKEELEQEHILIMERLNNNNYVKEFNKILKQEYVDKKNAVYKTKRITVDDVDISFNPASGVQLGNLLYNYLKIQPKSFTVKGKPAVDESALSKLKKDSTDEVLNEFLQAVMDFSALNKIQNTFIKTLSQSGDKLFGDYNMGTVVSGRLSASNSLQQMPSTGTKYAKAIKSCFSAPKGWVMVGIDYSSLEDYISALLTKDPNKLKVYMPVEIYKLEIDGKVYYVSDDDEIIIDGQSYRPSDLV